MGTFDQIINDKVTLEALSGKLPEGSPDSMSSLPPAEVTQLLKDRSDRIKYALIR